MKSSRFKPPQVKIQSTESLSGTAIGALDEGSDRVVSGHDCHSRITLCPSRMQRLQPQCTDWGYTHVQRHKLITAQHLAEGRLVTIQVAPDRQAGTL